MSPKVARHVLWVFDNGGIQPGHFITALLEAWRFADTGNSVRLANAFPDYGIAIELARDQYGITALHRIAKGHP